MRDIAYNVTGIGLLLKNISGLVVFAFLIYSLYFFGYHEFTIFKGILAFISLGFFMWLTSLIPFGDTFSPVLFEWWWHNIPFWNFTTLAWIVTGISLAANILLVAGAVLSHKQE